MLKWLISILAFCVVCSVQAGLDVQNFQHQNMSSSVRTNDYSFYVQSNDVVVMTLAGNKSDSSSPITFSSSAGAFVLASTADAYPTAYAAYLQIASTGTYDFRVVAGGALTASSGLYVLRADTGNIQWLETATFIDEDAAADTNQTLSYTTVTNGIVIEAVSSRSATVTPQDVSEDWNGSGKRLLCSTNITGTTFSSTYLFSGGEAGKLTASGIGLAFAGAGEPPEPPVPQTEQTNIVLIVIDDLGWMDLSIQGSEFYETPRIDQLAQSGMRFTQGYAAHPRCLPSRYGLMTGRFPGASAVPADPADLVDEEVTIGEALQPEGYATFFGGKWHISHEVALLPQNQGFDINITGGAPGSPPSYFYPYGNQPTDETDKNGLFLDNTTPVGGMVTDRITGKSYKRTYPAGESGEYITDRLTDEALDWMAWNADKPMFLYMSHYGVHTPYEAPADLVAKYEAKLSTMDYGDLPEYIPSGIGEQKMRQDHPTYAAMIESVDTNVGRLVDKVEELGISGNTIFIFTSDNGGLSNRGGNNSRTLATSNYPLRTGKGWLYEGGIREAFIVKGPGVARLVNSNAVINGTDIYPTILDLTGTAQRPDDHRNGVSFKSALDGSPYDRGESILWHSPKARPYSTGDFNSSALRDGDYKLIWWYDTPGRDGEFLYELYNVKTDPGENNDLALSMPDKAAELLSEIKAWHNHEFWERPGAGVSKEPDSNDVSKPPQDYLDHPTVPLSLNVSNLSWGAYIGFDYNVFSKTNLMDAAWTPESSGTTTNEATLPMVGNEGFYKVELALQPES
ncbi:sulfatase [Pontiellaceae bacterium B12227]|nr:sulfatase [Pontiellaceae bacterium B12227]